jgi:Ca2+-binding RTX toxin-like protein
MRGRRRRALRAAVLNDALSGGKGADYLDGGGGADTARRVGRGDRVLSCRIV